MILCLSPVWMAFQRSSDHYKIRQSWKQKISYESAYLNQIRKNFERGDSSIPCGCGWSSVGRTGQLLAVWLQQIGHSLREDLLWIPKLFQLKKVIGWAGMVPGFSRLKLTAHVTTTKNWHTRISLMDLGKLSRSPVDLDRFLTLISYWKVYIAVFMNLKLELI
jgi:hypothetical protein